LTLNFLFKSTPESGEIDKVLSAKSMAAIMLIGCLIETLTFCSSFKSFGSLTTINAGVGSGLKTIGEYSFDNIFSTIVSMLSLFSFVVQPDNINININTKVKGKGVGVNNKVSLFII
jgi:hypothetical protein